MKGSEKKVSLAHEIKYLRSFLELEKVRHGERLHLDVDIDEDADGHEIAPMLLIPFVENSFKHGLGKDLSEGFIKVSLIIEGQRMKFSISNSKPKNGSELSKQEGYKAGIGLKNVRKRLNLLYPNKHLLDVGDVNNEFVVSLQLELT